MRQGNRLLAIGSLLILLLGVVLVGIWLRVGQGQSQSPLSSSSTVMSNPCRGGWMRWSMDATSKAPLRLQGVAALSSYGQLTEEASVELTDVSGIPDGEIITVGSSAVFTQNPPIDNAAHNPTQPFVLVSCH